jgi:2-alkyl-3-oxoalkanoate reductase
VGGTETAVKALVTGGGGFLGRRIVALLRARGDEVRFLARGRHPEVEATGATAVRGDVRDRDAMRRAVDGVDIVFHAAARVAPWGPADEFRSINIGGTRILLECMRAAGTPRLVHTSTPSVVGYETDIENGDGGLPRAGRHASVYAATKAQAEERVLAANGPGLATVALRPHAVFGPGDRLLLPRLVARARAGTLIRVGDGRNRVDLTYVDNAAWAHLDAGDALTSHAAACAGRAYFVSNDEPVVLWDWIAGVLLALGLPPVRRRVPLRVARALGWTLERTWAGLRLPGEPPLTRYLASALARSHWYSMDEAKRDLGYRVRIPMAEATGRTIASLRADTAFSRSS